MPLSYGWLALVALLSKEELEKIPLRYRWLLKVLLRLPNPRIPFFVVKRITWFEGIFWALVVPVSLILYFFFSVWFTAFLALHVAFPLNWIVGLLIPAVFLVFFLRIEVERTILWWRHIHAQSEEWDVGKRVAELEEIFRRRKSKR